MSSRLSKNNIFFYQKSILIYDERKFGSPTVKGTILSDPPCKDGNTRLTMILLKLFSDTN